MNGLPAIRFMEGATTHKRFAPFEHAFSYDVTFVDLDIDRLNEAQRQSHWFSVDRANLMSVSASEHGERDGSDLRRWANKKLRPLGLQPEKLSIRLITLPRTLFYKFSPISLWIASAESGEPAAIIYEVHNTFGESHAYVSRLDGDSSRHETDKHFHVSPFFGVDGNYRFTLKIRENMLNLGIENVIEGERVHFASLLLEVRDLTGAAIWKHLFQRPLASFGVTVGIHFEALKLFLKGARYHRRPPLPKTPHTFSKTRQPDWVETQR